MEDGLDRSAIKGIAVAPGLVNEMKLALTGYMETIQIVRIADPIPADSHSRGISTRKLRASQDDCETGMERVDWCSVE